MNGAVKSPWVLLVEDGSTSMAMVVLVVLLPCILISNEPNVVACLAKDGWEQRAIAPITTTSWIIGREHVSKCLARDIIRRDGIVEDNEIALLFQTAKVGSRLSCIRIVKWRMVFVVRLAKKEQNDRTAIRATVHLGLLQSIHKSPQLLRAHHIKSMSIEETDERAVAQRHVLVLGNPCRYVSSIRLVQTIVGITLARS